MKKIFTSLGIFLIFTTTVMIFTVPAFAQDLGQVLTQIGTQSQLPGFETGHSGSSAEPGATTITSAILYAVDLLKYLLGTVAVIVIIASGVRLVTAGKNIEDIATKQKENIKYAIIGLVVIFVADTMVKTVFFGESGEIYRSETDVQIAAEAGTEQLRGLYNLMQVFVGTLAVLMIIFAGVRLVASTGNEEAITKSKKQILWAVVGLIVIGLSELVVKDIVFPKQGSQLPDVNRANELIVNITNFVSGFIATVCVAMLMYGGYLYVTAFGKEDQTGKAKKVLMGAVIGLLIAMASFGLVNTFIQFKPLPSAGTQEIAPPVPTPTIPTP